MNEKKEYIIKIKRSQAYLRNISDKKNMSYTFDIKIAKKCTIDQAKELLNNNLEEYEIVLYKQELYNIKNERFKVFVSSLTLQDNISILPEDIKTFFSELNKEGIYTASCNLSVKYPTNKLVNELERIAQKTELKNNCKGIYENHKNYRDICEEYDYDNERQLDILILAFKERYISVETLEESENELEEQ